ncbi:MAG TPA: STAS domain-containing protein [Gammaproteobacteria bacterium]|nr:STAS domain-containing protein [Gammaproteobacteria bacterium]
MNEKGHLMISGDLDFETVPFLWEQSLSFFSTSDDVHIDLGHITFSNSAGVALLIEWMKYAKALRKNIYFHHISSQQNSIIEAVGIDALVKTLS